MHVRMKRFLVSVSLFCSPLWGVIEITHEVRQELDLLIDTLSRTTDSPHVCGGRLTLTSGTPITTSDVTSATTVYFTPFNSNKLSLYNGSRWVLISFTEKSVSVPATTTTPFDIFGYDNSGTLALEAVNWTNDTTRATAITLQNGVYVKSGTATKRYLGTARTTSVSGRTEDSLSKRYLWNMCNRQPRPLRALSTTDSWSYTTATWRAANNDTTVGVTRLEYVAGLAYEPLSVEVSVPYNYNATAGDAAVGIGINSTSANSANYYGGYASTYYSQANAIYSSFPTVGYSYAQWLEISVAAGTTNWYTNSQSGGTQRQGGMLGVIWQ